MIRIGFFVSIIFYGFFFNFFFQLLPLPHTFLSTFLGSSATSSPRGKNTSAADGSSGDDQSVNGSRGAGENAATLWTPPSPRLILEKHAKKRYIRWNDLAGCFVCTFLSFDEF